MSDFNGERLKFARTYRGLNVEELAEKLDLQRQTVSMYENNKIKNPDYSTVENMAKQLNFPAQFFLEKDLIDIRSGSTYFRALLTTNKKYRNEQMTKMHLISILYCFLNEYIEFPVLNLPQIEATSDAEDLAMALRYHWHLGDGPIENLVYIVEQNGILVTTFDTNTLDIDAFSQYIDIKGDNTFLVAYSKNKNTAARIHFDVAHELGHILLHEWSEDIDTLSKEEFKERENEANSFASAFLLPKETFLKDLGQYANNLSYYGMLKKKWKVSISAMIRRAYTLGAINYTSYQQLMRTMQKKGIKKFEPLDDVLVTSAPTLLKTSVKMLLDNEVLTPRELLSELSLSYGLTINSEEIEYLLGLPKDSLRVSNVIPLHKLSLKTAK